jgi:hypothetical protein
VLARALLSFPYKKVKEDKSFVIRLDGNVCVLEEGKHYRILI